MGLLAGREEASLYFYNGMQIYTTGSPSTTNLPKVVETVNVVLVLITNNGHPSPHARCYFRLRYDFTRLGLHVTS